MVLDYIVGEEGSAFGCGGVPSAFGRVLDCREALCLFATSEPWKVRLKAAMLSSEPEDGLEPILEPAKRKSMPSPLMFST